LKDEIITKDELLTTIDRRPA